MKRGLLLAALLLLPSAAADLNEVTQPLEYTIEDATFRQDNPGPGELVNQTFVWVPPHSYTVTNRALILDISHTLTIVPESDGVWALNVYVDGVFMDDCTWHVETIAPGGFLEGDLVVYAYHRVTCHVDDGGTKVNLVEGPVSHNIVIERAVESGTPTEPAQGFISLQVLSQDQVVLTMPTNFETLTGLTGPEFSVLPLLALLGLFLWSRRDKGVRLLGTLLLLVDAGITAALAFTIRGESYGILLPLSVLFLFAAIYTFIVWILQITGRAPSPGGGI